MKRLFLFLLLLFPAIALAETPVQVEFLIAGLTDPSGDPLVGGKIYTYECGTTTDKSTWQDNAKASAHTNPIILDGEGKKLVFADGCYKFRIDNASDVTQYTHDNLRFYEYGGSATYADSTTGNSNAYVATLSPSLLGLSNGTKVSFIANHTNTGASTLNVNSLGAKGINSPDGTTLVAGDIVVNGLYTAIYDTSLDSWQLLSSPRGYTTWTPTLTVEAGTVSGQTNTCRYSSVGKRVFVQCLINWTQGSASTIYADVTLPVTPASINQVLTAAVVDDASFAGGYSYITSVSGTGTLRVALYNNGNMTTGSLAVLFSGSYYSS
jgi:hypothetical protein